MAEFGRPASAGAADDDQALLDRLRTGDDSAFGQLFSRHADAVRRFAMQQVRDAAEADDLTAESFFRVLQAVRRGNGPTDHVRTYLLTVARRVSWEWQARRRDVPVADEELDRRTEPYSDNSSRLAESTLISQAFSSLPERWRTVLWQVEVEGERPAVVAPHFGLSANATAALARRARDGLRAAYLQAHLTAGYGATACQSVREKLGGYTAGTVKGLEGRRIKAHLRGCPQCTTLQGELREVCSALRAHAGALVPLVGLGATAAVGGHLAAGGGLGATVAAKSALLATRLKLALTASSVAAVGVFGIAIGPWLSHNPSALPDHSDNQVVSTYCATSPGQPTAAAGGDTSTSLPTSTFANGHAASGQFQAAEGAKAAFFHKQRSGQPAGEQHTPPPQIAETSSPTATEPTVTETSGSVANTTSERVLNGPTSSDAGTSPTIAVVKPTTTADPTEPTKVTPSTTTAPRKTLPPDDTVTPTPSNPTPTTTSTSPSRKAQ
jgi:RNA polymerase sigma factor (sigma-70 family)